MQDLNKNHEAFEAANGRRFMIYKIKMLNTEFKISVFHEMFKTKKEIYSDDFKVKIKDEESVDKNYLKNEVFLLSDIPLFEGTDHAGYYLYYQEITNSKESSQFTP